MAPRPKRHHRVSQVASSHGVTASAPSSYIVLEQGVEVISSDGDQVGLVEHVLADEEEDIFDGIVVDTRLGPGGLVFVDAFSGRGDP